MHLLHNLVDKRYVAGWPQLANELQRIRRLDSVKYNNSKQAEVEAKENMQFLAWEKVYEFCERLYKHFAQEVKAINSYDEYYVEISRCEVQNYISDELNLLFQEERLAFEFLVDRV